MSKRLTDTSKWSDEWFSDLENDMKLVWLYLIDSCDHCGIIKKNIKLLRYHTGTVKEQLEIEQILGSRIVPFDGDKWFIPKFIKFQYSNGLGGNMPAVVAVRKALEKYNLLSTFTEEYINSSRTVKDKDKDKDKDILKEKEAREEKIYRAFAHLSISFGELSKLVEKGYNTEQVDEVLDAVQNYKKNKDYTSLYLTASKWLKKQFPEVTAEQPEKPKQIFYLDEPLASRQVKSMI